MKGYFSITKLPFSEEERHLYQKRYLSIMVSEPTTHYLFYKKRTDGSTETS